MIYVACGDSRTMLHVVAFGSFVPLPLLNMWFEFEILLKYFEFKMYALHTVAFELLLRRNGLEIRFMYENEWNK